MITDKKIIRFEMKYVCRLDTDCWEWIGSTKSGYGQYFGKEWANLAHRFSYMISNDDWNPELFVRHMCHNRLCVNPDHLRQGTNEDNMQDCIDRGDDKVVTKHGEMHFNAKLTEEIVLYLREQARTGRTAKSLSEELSLSESAVGRAIRGETWAHVSGAIDGDLYQRGNRHHRQGGRPRVR